MPAATGKCELHQTPKEKTPQRRTRLGVLNLPSRTLSTPRTITMFGTCRRDKKAMVG